MAKDEFTKQEIEQYEAIRKSGATNMFDYKKVKQLARKKGFTALANVASDRVKYSMLLLNYDKLMAKYNIK